MVELLRSLSLSNTAALVGLVSLVIPILIHIFNRSRGRQVFIGNINFVREASKIHVTELKITQWWLLLIRLIILILLTLLLADLVRYIDKTNSEASHVYLSKDWLETASDAELAGLKKEHSESLFFLFDKGFEEIDAREMKQARDRILVTKFKSALDKSDNNQVNVFALAYELKKLEKNTAQTFIYITNQLQNFSPSKPILPASLQWRIREIKTSISILEPITIFLLFDSNRQLDRDYFSLAFDALEKNSEISFKVRYALTDSNQRQSFASKPDWLIWLSDKTLPAEVYAMIGKGSYLLMDSSAVKPVDSRQKIASSFVTIDNAPDKIRLEFYQTSRKNNKEKTKIQLNESLWKNRFGDVVFSSMQHGKGKIFKFQSRFHPNFNNLVEKQQFPSILLKLFSSVNNLSTSYLVAASEITSTQETSTDIQTQLRLRSWLLLLLSLFWLLERWLSEQRVAVNE